MIIAKIAVLCFMAGVLSLTLKKDQPAFAFLVSTAGALVLLLSAARQLYPVLEFLNTLKNYTSAKNFVCLLRVLGIALCAQLAADFCKDAGMTAAAGAAELCGRLLALLEALPLLQGLVDSFLSFLS